MPRERPIGKKIRNGSAKQSAGEFRGSTPPAAAGVERSLFTPKMNGPTAADLAFDARFEPFTTKFLDQRRREKWRNNGKSFVRSESVNRFANFRKRLYAFRQDRTDIECFELTSPHIQSFF